MHTHTDAHKTFKLLVTPNLKPLPLKTFLSEKNALKYSTTLFYGVLMGYLDLKYSIKGKDFAGKQKWKRLERCIRKLSTDLKISY